MDETLSVVRHLKMTERHNQRLGLLARYLGITKAEAMRRLIENATISDGKETLSLTDIAAREPLATLEVQHE